MGLRKKEIILPTGMKENDLKAERIVMALLQNC